MGDRGPKKKAKATKQAEGTYRADRDDGPDFKVEIPDAPDWLCESAKAEWNRITPILLAHGVISQADQTVLGFYCQAVGDFLTAREALKQTGRIFLTNSGYPQQHPNVGVMNKARDAAVKIAREFGLTPSSRCGLPFDKAAEESDPLGDLLGNA